MSQDLIAPTVRQSVLETESQRIQRIYDAWTYYMGEAAKVLPVSSDGTDDNVRINIAATIVDKGVSWLFGADRSLPFGLDDDKAIDALDEFWPKEQRSLTFHKLGVNGGVGGHTFARLHDKSDDGPIRVVVWDPSNVEVIWDDDDIDKIDEYRYVWVGVNAEGDPYARRQRVINEGGHWEIVDEISRSSGAQWETVGTPETWPRDWAPVFHAQNLPVPNEFWGRADLEKDVLDLIDAIEGLAGGGRKLVRHKGHPIPWVTGESADKVKALNLAIGRLLAIPNPDATVGQLEAATLEGVVEMYDKLWDALFFVTRMPPFAFGILNSMANVKEDTVELAFASAIEKTWDKRLTYGPMLTDLTGRILELGGKQDLRPTPQWPAIIPRSDKSETESAEADLRMGIVSRRTISEQRGYDWATEEERLREQREASAADLANAFNSGNVEDE